MNVNKTKLPATKGFTTVLCRLWNMVHGSNLNWNRCIHVPITAFHWDYTSNHYSNFVSTDSVTLKFSSLIPTLQSNSPRKSSKRKSFVCLFPCFWRKWNLKIIIILRFHFPLRNLYTAPLFKQVFKRCWPLVCDCIFLFYHEFRWRSRRIFNVRNRKRTLWLGSIRSYSKGSDEQE